MEETAPELVNIMAYIAIVGGLILAAWWVIGLYWMHSREKERELSQMDVPGHIYEVHTGVPVVLIIYFIFTAMCLIGYMMAVWQYGVSY